MLKKQCKTIQVVKLVSNINNPQIFVKKKLQDFEKFKLTLLFHFFVWFRFSKITVLFHLRRFISKLILFLSVAGNRPANSKTSFWKHYARSHWNPYQGWASTEGTGFSFIPLNSQLLHNFKFALKTSQSQNGLFQTTGKFSTGNDT